MSRSIKVLCVLVVVLLSFSCAGKKTSYSSLDGFALGTTYHIAVELPDTSGLRQAVDSVFAVANNSMSVFNPESLLSRLNRNETDSLDRYITDCIRIADKVSVLSGGVYDITVKPLTDALGFAAKDAESETNIDSLLKFVDYRSIRVENGRLVKQHKQTQIDLNSVAKGYTVDMVARMLEKRGARNYIVEVGGEVFCKGLNGRGTEWVVGVDRPTEGNMIPGNELEVMIALTGSGLATSGNYRRYYLDDNGMKVVHTFNALTGESVPSNLLSATVVAADAATADAAATMFMAVGLERSIEILEASRSFSGYLVYSLPDGNFGTYISQSLESKIVR